MKKKLNNMFAWQTLLIFSALILIGSTLVATATPAQETKQDTPDPYWSDLIEYTKPATPVQVNLGVAELTPANSRVDFVGVHVGDKPDPRVGGIGEFSGMLKISNEHPHLESIEFTFNLDSVWTQIGEKLTNHLKSADFLNVEEHPKAYFSSTAINVGENGQLNIQGELELMGETQTIEFPATFSLDEQGVRLASKFQLDRTQFGMNFAVEKVASQVAIHLQVGQPTSITEIAPEVPKKLPPPPGQAEPAGNKPKFNAAASFDAWDKNHDGSLVGEEIPPRMRQRLPYFDTDQDGAVSRAEMMARFPN